MFHDLYFRNSIYVMNKNNNFGFCFFLCVMIYVTTLFLDYLFMIVVVVGIKIPDASMQVCRIRQNHQNKCAFLSTCSCTSNKANNIIMLRGGRYAACLVPTVLLGSFGGMSHMNEEVNADGKKTVRIHQPSFSATGTRAKPKFNLPPEVTLETLTLISGSSNKSLAASVAKKVNVPLCDAKISRFADGEVSVQINEDIRGKDVYIIQSCAAPVNDSIMELLLTVSCARRASARRVVAVIPYYGYKHHRRGNAVSTKHNSRYLTST